MRKFEYKFVINEEKRTVVALSSFAGEVVRGIARCAPTDVWNVEVGKQWAATRCSAKIAEKRMRRAEECNAIAADALDFWAERKAKMEHYERDSAEAYKKAIEDLKNLEKTFCV
jgi:hypothetical protein